MTTFGSRLKKLRKRAGLTLEQLAKKIDSTKSYIWELENTPYVRPSAIKVYTLAKALNTTVEFLIGKPKLRG